MRERVEKVDVLGWTKSGVVYCMTSGHMLYEPIVFMIYVTII